jgi:hypothetical protein
MSLSMTGHCPHCKQAKPLREDGRFYSHNHPTEERCSGSGQPPGIPKLGTPQTIAARSRVNKYTEEEVKKIEHQLRIALIERDMYKKVADIHLTELLEKMRELRELKDSRHPGPGPQSGGGYDSEEAPEPPHLLPLV